DVTAPHFFSLNPIGVRVRISTFCAEHYVLFRVDGLINHLSHATSSIKTPIYPQSPGQPVSALVDEAPAQPPSTFLWHRLHLSQEPAPKSPLTLANNPHFVSARLMSSSQRVKWCALPKPTSAQPSLKP